MPVVIKNSYNSGELAEVLSGRNDLAKYHNGCSRLVNATVLPYGGIVKRPGTKFIAKAKGACKLFRFEFSATDSIIIEAGNMYMRFFKDDDRVMEAAKSIVGITLNANDPVSIEITDHGYSTNDVVRFYSVTEKAMELTYSADLHNEYIITRTDANNFTLNGTDSADFTAYGAVTGTCKKAHEIVTPYSATEVFDLHTTQSGDVIYLAHTSHAPRMLSRVADNNWTIEAITFKGGPFLTENTTLASTLGFARTGGTARSGYYFPAGATGTLTAAGPGNTPFRKAHEGSLWLVKHTKPDNVSEIAAVGTSPAIRIKGDFTLDASNFATPGTSLVDLQRKEGNGDYQSYRKFTSATAYSATEEADDVYYRVVVSGANATVKLVAKDQVNRGIVRVDRFESPTVVNVTVIDPVLSNNTNDDAVPTPLWAEGAWSGVRGYPVTVCFHEDRLWWAGTTNNPQTLWGSVTGDYYNHTAGVADDDAVILAINDNDVSGIEWIASRKVLIVGTANKEYAISGPSFEDPITPSKAKAKIQSSHGSKHLSPVVLNDGLFYAQRQGRKMRIMRLNDYGDQFKSDDATILASHIFESAPVDMDIQRTPDAIVWVVRSDGTLCLFTYEPTEEVAAWSRLVTGTILDSPVDLFKSVKIISGPIEDAVWVVVNRTINAASVYYIEKFATRFIDQLDQALMLDCAKVSENPNASQDIILASDTVRYDTGVYGSSYYGGTKV